MANFCDKCGTRINANERFCPKCGNKIAVVQPVSGQPEYRYNININRNTEKKKVKKTKKEKVKMSKGKKAKIIVLSALSMILVLVISALMLFFTSPAFSVYQNMHEGNYSDALSNYNISVKNDFVQELFLDLTLKNYADEVIENFRNEELTYESASAALDVLSNMGFVGLSNKIKELDNIYSISIALAKGDEYYTDGDYGKAIQEYSKITEDDENYETVQAKLNEIYPKYIDDVNKKALDYISSSSYELALSFINTAFEIIPEGIDVSKLTTTRETTLRDYKTKIISDVTAFVNSGEFTDAIALVNNALKIDSNEDFKNLKNAAENKYVESVAKAVQKHLDNEDYISASRTVSAALEILPENSELKTLKTKVENSTPTYLLDVCKPYASLSYSEYINGEKFSMGGKEYTNGFILAEWYHDRPYAIFNVGSTYNSLSFTFGHCDGSDMTDGELTIYCDNVLVKTITFDCESLPQRISIDVTGVDQVKIQFVADKGPKCGFGNVVIK